MDKEHESLPPHRGSAPSQRPHLSCLKDPPPLARENAPRANLTRNGRLTGRPTRAEDIGVLPLSDAQRSHWLRSGSVWGEFIRITHLAGQAFFGRPKPESFAF